ncbi:MAG: hypothetical protein N2C14_29540, partial [Planctomycetales bacterium]
EMASGITIVSAERIQAELRGMLTGPQPAKALSLLLETGLLAAIAPEIAALAEIPARHVEFPASADLESPSERTLWDHAMRMVSRLRERSFSLVLGVMAAKIGVGKSPATIDAAARASEPLARALCQRLKTSNQDEEDVCRLVRRQGSLFGAENLPWSKLQPLLIEKGIEERLEFHRAECLTLGLADDDARYCRSRLELPAEELNPAPLLNGNDLIKHGVPRGSIYRVLLNRVRDAQLENEIRNKRQALALVDRVLQEESAS